MNRQLPHEDSRIAELLGDRATEGLDVNHSRELDLLMDQDPAIDSDALDVPAAALNVYWIREQIVPLPARLRSNVLEQYDQRLPAAPVQHVEPHAAAATDSQAAVADTRGAPLPASRRPLNYFGWQALGWYAAAASIVLAVFAWWPTADAQLSPADERRALLDQSNGTLQVAWAPSTHAGYDRVRGDVVWSNARQAGFMRLEGLPPNDKTKQQYQLWIVDPTRDKHPIDGGVFDVATAGGEVVIPIDAKLPVRRPAVFAITLESVGGVVVSDGPLLVTAIVPDDAG